VLFSQCGTKWNSSVSPEMIVKGCKKCCLSNAINRTDDNTLWIGSKEDGNFMFFAL